MNFDLWFPTPIWWEDTTDIEIQPILDLCYQLRTNDPAGRRLSNEGGWQSQDFEPGTHYQLKQLEEKIDGVIKKVSENNESIMADKKSYDELFQKIQKMEKYVEKLEKKIENNSKKGTQEAQ